MPFPKGSILEKLHSYGMLDNDTDFADDALNQKKAILARRQLLRQVRKPKFEKSIGATMSGCII